MIRELFDQEEWEMISKFNRGAYEKIGTLPEEVTFFNEPLSLQAKPEDDSYKNNK